MPLFMLFKAIKHQIDKGPVDALSGEARYSLSQERLLRLTVNTKQMVRYDSLITLHLPTVNRLQFRKLMLLKLNHRFATHFALK